MRTPRGLLIGLLGLVVPMTVMLGASADAVGVAVKRADNPDVVRLSVSNHEHQSNSASASSRDAVSADGRYVVFASAASNLVRGDTNGRVDVFVRDRGRGVTRRVSVSSHERQGNRDSGRTGSDAVPVISADGRYVAFVSKASNLVKGDTNGVQDVFVRDQATGRTSRVSVTRTGAQSNGSSRAPSLSWHGRYVAFNSSATNIVRHDTNHARDVFVRNRATGGVQRVSVSSQEAQSDGYSYETAISEHGRFVAFSSFASNLVPGHLSNIDVYVRDRRAGITEQVSVTSAGEPADGFSGYGGSFAIAGHGRYVAFSSDAGNLVPEDTNGQRDVFLRDRMNHTTVRVSLTDADGQADGSSDAPALSGDGRYVAFDSTAPNLAAAPSDKVTEDVFVRDLQTGTTRWVSKGLGGALGDSNSLPPAVSSDGHHLVFWSQASNLIPDDTNNTTDVFAASN
jgi:Tol biopolymer transport system component